MSARLRTFLGPGSTPGLAVASGWRGRLGFERRDPRDDGWCLLRMPTAAGNGHLALAEGAVMVSAFEAGGLSATAFTTGPLRPFMPATGAAVGWRPDGLPVGFTAGWISEQGDACSAAWGWGRSAASRPGPPSSASTGVWISEAGASGRGGEFGVVNPATQGGDDPGDLSRSRPAPSRSTGAGRSRSRGRAAVSRSRSRSGWKTAGLR